MLWGIVVIEEYAYRCVLSNAKIGLMVSDLPHIDYGKKKKETYIDGKLNLAQRDYDECVAANMEIERKYLESQKGQEINLTDLINKA